MTEEIPVVEVEVHSDRSLKDAWKRFAQDLYFSGASDNELNSMELAYYMGAIQTFSRISAAAQTDSKTFTRVMIELKDEIDARMKNASALNEPAQGSA